VKKGLTEGFYQMGSHSGRRRMTGGGHFSGLAMQADAECRGLHRRIALRSEASDQSGEDIAAVSLRVPRRAVQERVFAVMGIGEEEAQEKFGFLLDAFKYGAPPMGGIAFGWDRIISLLAGVDSIREVIAFPKTGNGYDPLTAAPAPITPQQRKEAGVDFKPKKDDEE